MDVRCGYRHVVGVRTRLDPASQGRATDRTVRQHLRNADSRLRLGGRPPGPPHERQLHGHTFRQLRNTTHLGLQPQLEEVVAAVVNETVYWGSGYASLPGFIPGTTGNDKLFAFEVPK